MTTPTLLQGDVTDAASQQAYVTQQSEGGGYQSPSMLGGKISGNTAGAKGQPAGYYQSVAQSQALADARYAYTGTAAQQSQAQANLQSYNALLPSNQQIPENYYYPSAATTYGALAGQAGSQGAASTAQIAASAAAANNRSAASAGNLSTQTSSPTLGTGSQEANPNFSSSSVLPTLLGD